LSGHSNKDLPIRLVSDTFLTTVYKGYNEKCFPVASDLLDCAGKNDKNYLKYSITVRKQESTESPFSYHNKGKTAHHMPSNTEVALTVLIPLQK
jgi:hypothetical protein